MRHDAPNLCLAGWSEVPRKRAGVPVCAFSRTSSLLPAESVGFQHLSLRHYAELRTTTLEPAPPRRSR
jgi:hypothetical protein